MSETDTAPVVDQQTAGRYTVVPRTLIFLERDDDVLLLHGADSKWFAGMYNGIGGHIEAGEDVRTAAERETHEETGLSPASLDLVATVHVTGDRPGVLLFVFRGTVFGDVDHTATDEGTLEWIPVAEISNYPLVPDLKWLLPRALANAGAPLSLTLHFTEEHAVITTSTGNTHRIPR